MGNRHDRLCACVDAGPSGGKPAADRHWFIAIHSPADLPEFKSVTAEDAL